MISRRKFLAGSGAVALGGLALNSQLKALGLHSMPGQTGLPGKMPGFGLQLFTLFSTFDEDVKGNLKKISDIGYREIESAFSKKSGYYGLKPREFAKAVKESGMTWRSHHVLGAPFKLPPGAKLPNGPDGKPITIPPMRNLTENNAELVAEAAEGGVEYLVCANIPISTKAEIMHAVEIFTKTGEACQKAGVQFAYHNHATEFDTIEGIQPFDYILSNTDKNQVKMELDLGWAEKAKQDPLELFAKHPGRFPLWHVKDFSADFSTITEVGAGSIDFKRIFDHADTSGMKYFFLEQDGAPKPMENIANSYNNLKKMLG